MMNKKDIPAKMLALQLKDPNLLYNCYMPFLEHGGLFVPTDDVFSLGEDILLAVEIADYPKRFLPTKVVWINPARTSAHPSQRRRPCILRTRKLPAGKKPDRSRAWPAPAQRPHYFYPVIPCI